MSPNLGFYCPVWIYSWGWSSIHKFINWKSEFLYSLSLDSPSDGWRHHITYTIYISNQATYLVHFASFPLGRSAKIRRWTQQDTPHIWMDDMCIYILYINIDVCTHTICFAPLNGRMWSTMKCFTCWSWPNIKLLTRLTVCVCRVEWRCYPRVQGGKNAEWDNGCLTTWTISQSFWPQQLSAEFLLTRKAVGLMFQSG